MNQETANYIMQRIAVIGILFMAVVLEEAIDGLRGKI